MASRRDNSRRASDNIVSEQDTHVLYSPGYQRFRGSYFGRGNRRPIRRHRSESLDWRRKEGEEHTLVHSGEQSNTTEPLNWRKNDDEQDYAVGATRVQMSSNSESLYTRRSSNEQEHTLPEQTEQHQLGSQVRHQRTRERYGRHSLSTLEKNPHFANTQDKVTSGNSHFRSRMNTKGQDRRGRPGHRSSAESTQDHKTIQGDSGDIEERNQRKSTHFHRLEIRDFVSLSKAIPADVVMKLCKGLSAIIK